MRYLPIPPSLLLLILMLVTSASSAWGASIEVKKGTRARIEVSGKYGCFKNAKDTRRKIVRVNRRIRIGDSLPVVNKNRERALLTAKLHGRSLKARAQSRLLRDLENLELAIAACTKQPQTPAPEQPLPEDPHQPINQDPETPPAPDEDTNPDGDDTPSEVLPTGFTGTLLSLSAITDSGLRGEITVAFDPALYDSQLDRFTYRHNPVQSIRAASGEVLATVRNLALTLDRSPAEVRLTFQLNVGAENLELTSQTARLGIPAVSGAQAQARASFFVRDDNNNGVHLSAVEDGIFRPSTHLNAISRQFGLLMGDIAISAGGQGSASHFDPPTGFRPIGESVDSVSGDSKFHITAGDHVVASTLFLFAP